jgi:hypothetical protein
MEKNKLSFILLFLVGIMFGQTSANVSGVVFSYDKETDTMKLLVPNDLMNSEDPDWQKEIKITKEYELNMSEIFYYSCGRNYERGSINTYYFPECDKCEFNAITSESFSLKFPPKGEYIITVSDVCDEKWRTNSKKGSIIIN